MKIEKYEGMDMPKFAISPPAKKGIAKVSEASKLMWEKGWAERNGGNVSVNLTGLVKVPRELKGYRHVEAAGYPKEAAGMVFFSKRTGERIRDLVLPKEGGCIVRMDDRAKGYHVLWEGPDIKGGHVTSEFLSHVMIHLQNRKVNNSYRAVVHTHPTELLALSHHPRYNKDEALLNETLWSMLPEVRAFTPRGVALTPYTLPGSKELALLTARGLAQRDVVLWGKHGAIASGPGALEAFDYIDVANKGATVFLKCLESGFTPEGMSKKEMEELARAFKL